MPTISKPAQRAAGVMLPLISGVALADIISNAPQWRTSDQAAEGESLLLAQGAFLSDENALAVELMEEGGAPGCWRRPKIDHLCRLKIDQGKEAAA